MGLFVDDLLLCSWDTFAGTREKIQICNGDDENVTRLTIRFIPIMTHTTCDVYDVSYSFIPSNPFAGS